MAGMIVLDAGVLIAHLDPNDAHHDSAKSFLESHVSHSFAMSALTIAECLVRPSMAGAAARVEATVDLLQIGRVSLNGSDSAGLAQVRADTALRMPDAVVLFTAESHGAELATTDAALHRAAHSRGVSAHLV